MHSIHSPLYRERLDNITVMKEMRISITLPIRGETHIRNRLIYRMTFQIHSPMQERLTGPITKANPRKYFNPLPGETSQPDPRRKYFNHSFPYTGRDDYQSRRAIEKVFQSLSLYREGIE